ncbi:MAG: hypothetical protein GY757_62105 [bacterium]|nr:hypothetical protein [bacterium]
MTNQKDDQMIKDMVRSVNRQVPSDIKRKLKLDIYNAEEKRLARKNSLFWYPAATFASLIIILLLVANPFAGNDIPDNKAPVNRFLASSGSVDGEYSESTQKVREIRTEFEIKKKKIKVIWFQRKTIKTGSTS